jgi:hypothetical protein
MNKDEFRKDLEGLINRHSMENGSNTPDFMLSSYLVACLLAFDEITKARDKWYRGDNDPPNPAQSPRQASIRRS